MAPADLILLKQLLISFVKQVNCSNQALTELLSACQKLDIIQSVLDACLSISSRHRMTRGVAFIHSDESPCYMEIETHQLVDVLSSISISSPSSNDYSYSPWNKSSTQSLHSFQLHSFNLLYFNFQKFPFFSQP